MYSNLSKTLFMMTLITGVMMSISSNNWILIWCGLEISLVSFIPLMISNKMISSESLIKYFIVQSVSSSLLMLGMMVMIMSGDYNYDYLVTSSLLIKMGVAPFHNWILTVIEGLKTFPTFLMLTVTKIAPLTLMSYTTYSFTMLAMINAILSSIMSINQNSVKKLIAYSSIFNMTFMLLVMKFNSMWMIYIIMYSMLLMILLLMMSKLKINYINQMIIMDMNLLNKVYLWMIMLSMAGMPPLVGFSIKYMVLQTMILNKFFILTSILILTSLIMMMMYLRMTFISVMNLSMSMKTMNFNMKSMKSMMILLNLMVIPILMTMKMFN